MSICKKCHGHITGNYSGHNQGCNNKPHETLEQYFNRGGRIYEAQMGESGLEVNAHLLKKKGKQKKHPWEEKVSK